MYQLLTLMYQIFDVQKTKEEGGEAEAVATKAAIEIEMSTCWQCTCPLSTKSLIIFFSLNFQKKNISGGWWFQPIFHHIAIIFIHNLSVELQSRITTTLCILVAVHSDRGHSSPISIIPSFYNDRGFDPIVLLLGPLCIMKSGDWSEGNFLQSRLQTYWHIHCRIIAIV